MFQCGLSWCAWWALSTAGAVAGGICGRTECGAAISTCTAAAVGVDNVVNVVNVDDDDVDDDVDSRDELTLLPLIGSSLEVWICSSGTCASGEFVSCVTSGGLAIIVSSLSPPPAGGGLSISVVPCQNPLSLERRVPPGVMV